jgi:hypothetical protein
MDTKRKKTGVAILCVALVSIIFTGATLTAAATDNSIASGSITAGNQTGQISTDGGQTWMDREEYQKMYSTRNIVWWTYDEYKAWLEQEKLNCNHWLMLLDGRRNV